MQANIIAETISQPVICSILGGYEYLLVRKPEVLSEILLTVSAMKSTQVDNNSPENLYNALNNRDNFAIFDNLLASGWKKLIDFVDTTTRHKIICIIKDRIALNMQSGETNQLGHLCSDISHSLYVRDEIDVGIEILPMKSLQSEMSSGPGYYEGELYNVIRNGRGAPSVPLIMIGIAPLHPKKKPPKC